MVRGRLAPVVVGALVLALCVSGAVPAIAQSPGAGAQGVGDRCAAWGASAAAASLHAPRGAARPRALAQTTTCALPRVRLTDAWSSPAARRVLGWMGAKEGWTWSDPVGDATRLDGGPLTGSHDPATDVTSLSVAPVKLSKKTAAALAKRLAAAAAKPEPALVVSLPQPASRLVRAGRYQLILLRTVGDPTTTPANTRFYDLLWPGEPGQTLPGVFLAGAGAGALPGARWAATFSQSIVDGTVQNGAGLTDFNDPALGRGRTDQFYNTTPGYLAITLPEGIVFLVPEAQAGGAIRAATWDLASDGWDLVHAPDGPLAMLPIDGVASGAFAVAQLGLDHTPVTQASGSLGGTPFSDRSFASHQELALLVDAEQAAAMATLDLVLDIDGQQLELPGLVPELTPAGDRSAAVFTFGIPSYGRYRLEAATGQARGGTRTDLTADLRRTLGFDSWQVDQAPGVVGPGLLAGYLRDVPGGDAYGRALLRGAWRPATTP